MYVRAFIVAAAASITLSAAAPAGAQDPLPRRTQFGVMVEPNPGGGLRVRAVSPALTAAAAGILEGDVLVSVEGVATNAPGDLVSLGDTHRAGQSLQFTVRRGETLLRLEGVATSRPREAYPGASLEYGSVSFQGGRLRTIFAAPDTWKDGPVLYMLQGHPCTSVEATHPGDPNQAFIGGMLARGIAVYRIEKPGVGDSLGGPRCEKGDFGAELAGFEAGWSDLTETRGVDNERIFLFGHSMGGVDAPLLAAAHRDAPPRGVVVYGTVLRNFHDYLFDLLRLQSFLMTGADPVAANQLAETARPTLRRLILDGVEPAELIAEGGAEAESALRELGWDGGSGMMGHAIDYWRDLARRDVTAAWRDTYSAVLSLYGETDLTALTEQDAVTIAQVVNHYRPGTARFSLVANADHLMSIAPARAEAIGDAAANAPMMGQAPPRPLNPEFPRLIGDWVDATLAEPSVRTSQATRDTQLWFNDAAERLPPLSDEGRNGMAVIAADLDGDADLDLVVPQEFSLNKILLNDGAAGFDDASDRLPRLNPDEVPPPAPPAHDTEDAAVADFNGDGLVDIVFVSEDDFSRLRRRPTHEYYRGAAGGGFVRILGCLPDSAANGVAAADVTGDGWLDLLVVGEGQDRLLVNDGGGCFRDETEARLPAETHTGQDAQFVNVDGDADLDLVIGYEGGHQLWINGGAGAFKDETGSRLPDPGNVEARKIAVGDIDGDGDADLYFAHVGWQGRAPQDKLYLNDGRGRYTDVTDGRLPSETDTTLSAVFADFDGDGDMDLATVGSNLRIFSNDGTGTFTDVSERVLPTRIAGPLIGLAVADLDGDGDPDLYGSMLSRSSRGGPTAHDWMLLNRTKAR
ncbi:FG-GAP-like repeat-containing protein [Roseibacterium beibuensis]|uniref:FG-GAP-like repeat-containing protein n=1 Tax=[Roseibacterium] beibuensis TaxID=1193142 RepID=UPI00217D2F24|nr:FG-GAP-like repeat-containing protein [Roseibacterium beibuensis]MCS6625424.1 FG-GAP-like repeat-containing protein [Roseibacterium beibuensis]